MCLESAEIYTIYSKNRVYPQYLISYDEKLEEAEKKLDSDSDSGSEDY